MSALILIQAGLALAMKKNPTILANKLNPNPEQNQLSLEEAAAFTDLTQKQVGAVGADNDAMAHGESWDRPYYLPTIGQPWLVRIGVADRRSRRREDQGERVALRGPVMQVVSGQRPFPAMLLFRALAQAGQVLLQVWVLMIPHPRHEPHHAGL